MSFSGRSNLTSLMDQLVEVGGGPQVPAGENRPVLVLVGHGGSGRSALLHSAWAQWASRTPAVVVNPASLNSSSMRSVLPAVMLGLSGDVPGYKVSFPRVVLAHIAMAQPVTNVDPQQATSVMCERLNKYRDSAAVIGLVGNLVKALGSAAQHAQAPIANVVAPNVATAVAEDIVRRLRRSPWLTKLTWKSALHWFGHQDRKMRNVQRPPEDPVRALVNLSIQAHSDHPAVQRDVDDVLMAALLADLRDSLARVAGRPWNAVVFLDNADAEPAMSFITALVRMRQNLALAGASPDPLAVVAVSDGPLVASLAGHATSRVRWTDSRLTELSAQDIRQAGAWLMVGMGDLSAEEVGQLARAHVWPPSSGVGFEVVEHIVYRLTSGHAAGTSLVLRSLQAAPELIDDLDEVLRRPGPTPDCSAERYLLDQVVASLSRHQRVDPYLRDDLVTLSAARDQEEAQLLKDLLKTPPTVQPALFMSMSLWSSPGPRGYPALAPFARYLLLRALAARGDTGTGRPQWDTVFTVLRDCAAKATTRASAAAAGTATGDLAGLLHHCLALGETVTVAKELHRLLTDPPGWSGREWLALLDQVVASPHLRPSATASGDAADAADGPTAHIKRLVADLAALSDRRLSDRTALRNLYLRVSHCYLQIADDSPKNLTMFFDRALHYQRLADSLF